MDPVPRASSVPRAALSLEDDDTPPSTPPSPDQPGLSQPDADGGVRRFFQAASGHLPAQPPGQQPAHTPPVLSQACSALPPPDTQD